MGAVYKIDSFVCRVCTKAGDRVPGPRSYALLAPVEFPWKSSVDHLEHVSALDSYSMSLDLCRQGIICGPSSGFNLRGIFQYIEKRKVDGTLSELAGPDGDIHCVFLCCDLPYQYINEYFDKLGESYFPVIKNEVYERPKFIRKPLELPKEKLTTPFPPPATYKGRSLQLRQEVGKKSVRSTARIFRS